jgi:hypothetical protein
MRNLFYPFFLFSLFNVNALAQTNNYDFDNWPGKEGKTKTNIKINDQIISSQNLFIANKNWRNSFFYKIPLETDDVIFKGRIQGEAFSNVEKAQLALIDYLKSMTAPTKPLILDEKFPQVGDIAFGIETNGILRIAFARNNILIIIYSSVNNTIKIAQEIDESIIVSPECDNKFEIPAFIF